MGIPTDERRSQNLVDELNKCLEHLETCFLKETPYLCGQDISIADLACICELTQLYGGGLDVSKTGRPKLAAWMARTKTRLQPHFDNNHMGVYEYRKKYRNSLSNL